MDKLILVILLLLFPTMGKAQGGSVLIPANLQNEIYNYISSVDIDDHQIRFTSSRDEGKIFTWQIPLKKDITKEICIHSPEKLVQDDNLSSRILILYKQNKNEVDLILWVRDKDGDVFGSILNVSKRQKNNLIKKSNLSGFEERFKKD